MTKTNKKVLFVFKGKNVTNEMCYCKHLRSAHEDLLPGVPGMEGKGGCEKCKCERFTWKEFVFEKEKEKTHGKQS